VRYLVAFIGATLILSMASVAAPKSSTHNSKYIACKQWYGEFEGIVTAESSIVGLNDRPISLYIGKIVSAGFGGDEDPQVLVISSSPKCTASLLKASFVDNGGAKGVLSIRKNETGYWLHFDSLHLPNQGNRNLIGYYPREPIRVIRK